MNNRSLTERLVLLTPGQKILLQQRLAERTVNGHEMVALSLKKMGITHVYSVAGVPIHETLAACSERGIRIVGVHHQQAAVMMALSQNYIEGRMIAAVIISKGPAILNAITGISVAKDNCWPVLVIAGGISLSMQGIGGFQELDTIPIMQPITKWCTLISCTEDIENAIESAFGISTSERHGPTFVEIPEDILNTKNNRSDFDSISIREKEESTLPLHTIQSAVGILFLAKRPLIIIGNSVRWCDAHEEIRILVEVFNIPFITSVMGQGYLSDDHKFCFNTDRSHIQNNADVVLLIGARFNWTFRFGSELSRQCKIIQFDADKNELGKNIFPEVSVAGDIKKILNILLIQMNHTCSQYLREDAINAWFDSLKKRRSEKSVRLQLENIETSNRVSPVGLMKEIRDFFPKDTIYIMDGNVSMSAAQKILPGHYPASRLTAGTNGCMGVGIPYGIGAKLAQPKRCTVVISGDFAFGLNGMELETALRYKVPIIVIVVNNSGPSGALFQNKFFSGNHDPVSLFIQDIHYDKMIIAFGGHSERVRSHEELIPAFKRAMDSGKASLVNVIVDPDARLNSRL